MSMRECCLACGHFRNGAAELEAAMPGLSSLGSAHGSARADDGLCLKHDRYVRGQAHCDDYAPVTMPR
jgi:hypothetical protein